MSFLLAWLTYRYVEIPVRRSGKKNISLGSDFFTNDFRRNRIITPHLVLFYLRLDWLYVNEEAIKAINDWAYPAGLISRNDLKEINSPVQYNANSSKNPKILLVGDSHMEQSLDCTS